MAQHDRKGYITNATLQPQEAQLRAFFTADDAPIIFDIGACEGESSIRYARCFPKARVFTFEPVPDNFKKIQANIETYACQGVRAFELCLSDTDGTADFYVSSGHPDAYKDTELDWEFGNKSSSLLPPDQTLDLAPWLKFKQKATVPTRRLDSLWPELDIDHIDFVHLDVQGAELMVLGGAGEYLKEIRCVWLEVEAVQLYEGQPLKADIERYLLSNGYIKLIDTVDTVDAVAGDQFWALKHWLKATKGEAWVRELETRMAREERYKKIAAVFRGLQRKTALRTRLRKLIGGR